MTKISVQKFSFLQNIRQRWNLIWEHDISTKIWDKILDEKKMNCGPLDIFMKGHILMHKFSQEETVNYQSVGTSWESENYSCESETVLNFPRDQFEMIRTHQK